MSPVCLVLGKFFKLLWDCESYISLLPDAGWQSRKVHGEGTCSDWGISSYFGRSVLQWGVASISCRCWLPATAIRRLVCISLLTISASAQISSQYFLHRRNRGLGQNQVFLETVWWLWRMGQCIFTRARRRLWRTQTRAWQNFLFLASTSFRSWRTTKIACHSRISKENRSRQVSSFACKGKAFEMSWNKLIRQDFVLYYVTRDCKTASALLSDIQASIILWHESEHLCAKVCLLLVSSRHVFVIISSESWTAWGLKRVDWTQHSCSRWRSWVL